MRYACPDPQWRQRPHFTPRVDTTGAFVMPGGRVMRLTIRILGLDLLGIELATSDEDDDDKARDLSGGSLGAERIEAGATDWHMGFTNGRGEE